MTVKLAFAIAGIIILLIIYLRPAPRDQPDIGLADLRSRILEALSDAANREFHEADYGVSTAKYFTPHEVISAVDFIEGQLEVAIPRSVYWQDTIGELTEALVAFAESNITQKN